MGRGAVTSGRQTPITGSVTLGCRQRTHLFCFKPTRLPHIPLWVCACRFLSLRQHRRGFFGQL